MKFILMLMLLMSLLFIYTNGSFIFLIITVVLFVFYKKGILHGMVEEYKEEYENGNVFRKLRIKYSIKRSISLLVGYIFVCMCMIYCLFTDDITIMDRIRIQKLKGVYISETWDEKGSTITLNDDLTCLISLSNAECKWKIEDNEINIIISYAYSDPIKYKAILKNNGFIIDGYFFEKIN